MCAYLESNDLTELNHFMTIRMPIRKKLLQVFNDNHNNGFAVSQILIALLMSLIVIYGVMAALEQGNRHTSHSRYLALADEAADFVAALLVSPNYCSINLKDLRVSPDIPSNVAKNLTFKELTTNGTLAERTIIGVGSQFKNILKISSLDLNIDHQVGPQRYLASISIGITGANTGYFNHIERSISLFVTTNSAGLINGCSRLNYQTFSGKGSGEFSKTCDDFAAKGWPSKETCLRDGRWHLVYVNQAGSSDSLYGSAIEFAQYVIEGADSHIIGLTPEGSMTGSHRCQGIEVRSAANRSSFACHEPYRIEMIDWERKPTSFKSLHGATWFNSGYTNKPGWGSPEPIGVEWYVRF